MMRGVHSLSRGLFVSLMIAATVFGAFILSVRSSSNLLAELPIPTVTLELVSCRPRRPRPGAANPVTPAIITPTSTPSPTPAACPLPAD
jgi:hypothetical protein